ARNLVGFADIKDLGEEGILGVKDVVRIKGFDNLVKVGGLGSFVGVDLGSLVRVGLRSLVRVGFGSLVRVKNHESLVGDFVEIKNLVVIQDLIKIKYF
ncbi:11542_t:CDS:1, partial [Scutellospora calospora]